MCIHLNRGYNLVCGCTNNGNLTVVLSCVLSSIPHVKESLDWIVRNTIGSAVQLDRILQTKCLPAEDPDHSVIPAGHENLVQTRYKQNPLWFLEAWNSTLPLGCLQIEHFHLSI